MAKSIVSSDPPGGLLSSTSSEPIAVDEGAKNGAEIRAHRCRDGTFQHVQTKGTPHDRGNSNHNLRMGVGVGMGVERKWCVRM